MDFKLQIDTLKDHLEGKFDLARGTVVAELRPGRLDHAEAGSRYRIPRLAEVRSVGQIEAFRAELNIQLVPHWKVLEQREIDVAQ